MQIKIWIHRIRRVHWIRQIRRIRRIRVWKIANIYKELVFVHSIGEYNVLTLQMLSLRVWIKLFNNPANIFLFMVNNIHTKKGVKYS